MYNIQYPELNFVNNELARLFRYITNVLFKLGYFGKYSVESVMKLKETYNFKKYININK
jgi:hypothetical protein